MIHVTRRHALICIAALATEPACAAPIEIAVPNFAAGTPADTELARTISSIIAVNLGQQFQWFTLTRDAQVRVTGTVTKQADGRIRVEFHLWNGDTQLAWQQYFSTPSNSRRIGNIISNAVYERLTGEKGNFSAP